MSNSTAGPSRLQRNQFIRACDLMDYLNGMICTFTSETAPRLHADQASRAIQQWLSREYELGRQNGKRHV